MKRLLFVLSLFSIVAVGMIMNESSASANNMYTNRNDYTNVYKFVFNNRGNRMIHFHNYKRLGKFSLGRHIRFNGNHYCYIQKVDGYVPTNQLKKVYEARNKNIIIKNHFA
ncbi:hypothetical protein MOO46_05670 [Apilactobacillus apisilvae]|uniref:Surface layer protein A domain-containing protein n=1 Tax=Apilactobacillus apisilvae TaxID=2923364 RepID=A0ABY4PGP0_9LACO|nr:hypothetical protein [Apilactobacillus apisilvae]UQS84735.1 hypothetical protein MOO46_05670 [Apilactobacillus apisilvae]